MSGWRGRQREQGRHAKRTKDRLKDKERREEAEITREQREDELKPGLCSSMPTDNATPSESRWGLTSLNKGVKHR